MPMLSDAELRIVAEIVAELAKHRGNTFNRVATGSALARAALVDPAFKAKLVEIYRRLEARCKTDIPRKLLAPLTKSGGDGSAMLGHSDRKGLRDDDASRSWNSSHPSRGCNPEGLKSTGSAGLLYCFAVN